MTITIADTETTITLDLLEWRDDRECNVAIRDVPLRGVPKIDIGTYTLGKKILSLRCRGSVGERGKLIGFYDKKALVIITDGSWSYSCWFMDKPITYKFTKQNVARDWLIDMRFVVSSYTCSETPCLNDCLELGVDAFQWLYTLGLEIGDTTSVSRHEWVNDEEEIKTEVWNIEPYTMTYRVRATQAEKYSLDVLLESHVPIKLVDNIYGITGYVWFQSMTTTNDKRTCGPFEYLMKDVDWLIDINLIVIWAVSESWDFWLGTAVDINDDVVYNEGTSCQILTGGTPCDPILGTMVLLFEDYPLVVDDIGTFTVKVRGTGDTSIIVLYTDDTTTVIGYTPTAYPNWEIVNILSYLTAGKSIKKITLSKSGGWIDLWYDDIILEI